MPRWKQLLTPALWIFYVAIVLEILFMISPFALYFYSLYGPTLNLLHLSPWTSWLTGFFLPHFSVTSSPLLGYAKAVAGTLILVGVIGFAIAFVQVYWAKLLRKGAVTSGFYRVVRHPQYVALAVLGLGTLLLWPRFTVLLMYVTMLCLYSYLARHEEELCLERFGDEYRSYYDKTGRFLPRMVERYLPEPRGSRGAIASLGVWLVLAGVAVACGFLLRDYSLNQVAGFYEEQHGGAVARAVEPRAADARLGGDADITGSRGDTRPGPDISVRCLRAARVMVSGGSAGRALSLRNRWAPDTGGLRP